ncbi:MAG: hypothetical protein F7C33_02270 [Desulfurococcales archaeon]|nr:hypothetical protein [Desulfurococcales archaeon]
MPGLAWMLMLVGGILGVITAIAVIIINYINSSVKGKGEEPFDPVQAVFSLILGVLFAVQGYLGVSGELSETVEAALSIGVFIIGVALVAYNLKTRRYRDRRARIVEP